MGDRELTDTELDSIQAGGDFAALVPVLLPAILAIIDALKRPAKMLGRVFWG